MALQTEQKQTDGTTDRAKGCLTELREQTDGPTDRAKADGWPYGQSKRVSNGAKGADGWPYRQSKSRRMALQIEQEQTNGSADRARGRLAARASG